MSSKEGSPRFIALSGRTLEEVAYNMSLEPQYNLVRMFREENGVNNYTALMVDTGGIDNAILFMLNEHDRLKQTGIMNLNTVE